jgi:hypothetical protein
VSRFREGNKVRAVGIVRDATESAVYVKFRDFSVWFRSRDLELAERQEIVVGDNVRVISPHDVRPIGVVIGVVRCIEGEGAVVSYAGALQIVKLSDLERV